MKTSLIFLLVSHLRSLAVRERRIHNLCMHEYMHIHTYDRILSCQVFTSCLGLVPFNISYSVVFYFVEIHKNVSQEVVTVQKTVIQAMNESKREVVIKVQILMNLKKLGKERHLYKSHRKIWLCNLKSLYYQWHYYIY